MIDMDNGPTATTTGTDGRERVHVDYYVDRGAGAPVDVPVPLVRMEVEDPGEGYRAAYITSDQARALAGVLLAYADRADAAAAERH